MSKPPFHSLPQSTLLAATGIFPTLGFRLFYDFFWVEEGKERVMPVVDWIKRTTVIKPLS